MGSEWQPVRRASTSGSTMVADEPNGFWNTTYGPNNLDPKPAPQPSAPPRWYEPRAEPRNSKVFVNAADVRQIIANALSRKLSGDFHLFLGDNTYFFPSVSDAQEIISNSGLSRATYMPETFDCDDYAIVLKSHFCEAAYKNYDRRAPHCVGLIWGELPHVHAVNWMINDDYRLRLIEPQTGEVFEPRPDHRNITFMMA